MNSRASSPDSPSVEFVLATSYLTEGSRRSTTHGVLVWSADTPRSSRAQHCLKLVPCLCIWKAQVSRQNRAVVLRWSIFRFSRVDVGWRRSTVSWIMRWWRFFLCGHLGTGRRVGIWHLPYNSRHAEVGGPSGALGSPLCLARCPAVVKHASDKTQASDAPRECDLQQCKARGTLRNRSVSPRTGDECVERFGRHTLMVGVYVRLD